MYSRRQSHDYWLTWRPSPRHLLWPLRSCLCCRQAVDGEFPEAWHPAKRMDQCELRHVHANCIKSSLRDLMASPSFVSHMKRNIKPGKQYVKCSIMMSCKLCSLWFMPECTSFPFCVINLKFQLHLIPIHSKLPHKKQISILVVWFKAISINDIV